MTIEKGIRACLSAPQETGHMVSSTPGTSQKAPILDTSKRSGVSALLSSEAKKFPQSITLEMLLKDLPLANKTTRAQVVKDGKHYSPTLFYDPVITDGDSQKMVFYGVQEIELFYTDVGFYEQDGKRFSFKGREFSDLRLCLKEGEALYRQDFKTQTKPLLRQVQTLIDRSYLYHLTGWRSGRLETFGLLGFGGYLNPSLGLDHVCQSFARLGTTDGKKTKLVIKSLIQWQECGVVYPYGGRYQNREYIFYPSPSPEDSLSLGSAIQGGGVKIQVEFEGRKKTYESVAYEKTQLSKNFFRITFLPIL